MHLIALEHDGLPGLEASVVFDILKTAQFIMITCGTDGPISDVAFRARAEFLTLTDDCHWNILSPVRPLA
jgi:hypothetical protein